jgi:hypothetical protein
MSYRHLKFPLRHAHLLPVKSMFATQQSPPSMRQATQAALGGCGESISGQCLRGGEAPPITIVYSSMKTRTFRACPECQSSTFSFFSASPYPENCIHVHLFTGTQSLEMDRTRTLGNGLSNPNLIPLAVPSSQSFIWTALSAPLT